MKKILALCIVALFAIPFVSCEKDNDKDTDNKSEQRQGATDSALLGTLWTTVINETDTIDDEESERPYEVNFRGTVSFEFTSKTNANVIYNVECYIDGIHTSLFDMKDRDEATYTYDNATKQGNITVTYYDEDEEQDVTEVIEFIIDGNELRASMSLDGGESEILTFNRQ